MDMSMSFKVFETNVNEWTGMLQKKKKQWTVKRKLYLQMWLTKAK